MKTIARATNDKGQAVELVRYLTGNYQLIIDGQNIGFETGRASGFAGFADACRVEDDHE